MSPPFEEPKSPMLLRRDTPRQGRDERQRRNTLIAICLNFSNCAKVLALMWGRSGLGETPNQDTSMWSARIGRTVCSLTVARGSIVGPRLQRPRDQPFRNLPRLHIAPRPRPLDDGHPPISQAPIESRQVRFHRESSERRKRVVITCPVH
jgi:hypothetical protein